MSTDSRTKEWMMGTYLVTGSASGMGRASADALRAQGHRVIGLDLKEGEVIADLSTSEGRSQAVTDILGACDGRLDGAVLAAGLGPQSGRERCPIIMQVNFYGVVDLLKGLHGALAADGGAKVVIIGSNSTTTMPMIPTRAVNALLRDDLERATKVAGIFGDRSPNFAYGASKIAVTRWMRRAAVTEAWVGRGILLNAIAPGAILTPLLEKQLADPGTAQAIHDFPVPTGGFGKPEQIGQWVAFMLGEQAEFLCGSVITLDGGTDAWFRADDWPVSVPIHRLRWYMNRMKEFAARKR